MLATLAVPFQLMCLYHVIMNSSLNGSIDAFITYYAGRPWRHQFFFNNVQHVDSIPKEDNGSISEPLGLVCYYVSAEEPRNGLTNSMESGKLGGDLHYTSDNSVGDCSCTCSIYSFIRYSKTFLFIVGTLNSFFSIT